jgi:hypothetical protein
MIRVFVKPSQKSKCAYEWCRQYAYKVLQRVSSNQALKTLQQEMDADAPAMPVATDKDILYELLEASFAGGLQQVRTGQQLML